MSPTGDPSERQRRDQESRKRNERQRGRREQFIERIARLHRRRLRPSPQRPSEADVESIEGPAPGEDSSVPPDPPPRV